MLDDEPLPPTFIGVTHDNDYETSDDCEYSACPTCLTSNTHLVSYGYAFRSLTPIQND